jgi:hypothetical protein
MPEECGWGPKCESGGADSTRWWGGLDCVGPGVVEEVIPSGVDDEDMLGGSWSTGGDWCVDSGCLLRISDDLSRIKGGGGRVPSENIQTGHSRGRAIPLLLSRRLAGQLRLCGRLLRWLRLLRLRLRGPPSRGTIFGHYENDLLKTKRADRTFRPGVLAEERSAFVPHAGL